jgi:hypothetical protein
MLKYIGAKPGLWLNGWIHPYQSEKSGKIAAKAVRHEGNPVVGFN